MQQISMFDILVDQPDKKYQRLVSNVGVILYAFYGEYVKFRNITLGDSLWSFASVDGFNKRFRNNCKPIETFASKRISGFNSDKVIVVAGDIYHLVTKKNFDGYLYEVNATMLKVFTKKDYPDRKFVYTKYHIDSLCSLSLMDLERIKANELRMFNRYDYYDVHVVSEIASKVHEFINGRRW